MYPNGFYNMPFVNPYNAVGAASALPRTGGLLSKLGLRNINFGNILTNTSKTLNVINQAIPVVKQVGPMFNNMKSILKVASLFNDATTPRNNNNNNNSSNNKVNNETSGERNENTITNNSYSNSPNFFI
ncbi:MAG: YqfQ family protein [Bacilli bacterium]|nr:YqfQ family protein [Bacilli bacterium]